MPTQQTVKYMEGGEPNIKVISSLNLLNPIMNKNNYQLTFIHAYQSTSLLTSQDQI